MEGLFVLGIVATPFLFAAWLVNRILEHRLRVRQIEAAGWQARALPAGAAAELPLEQRADIERRLANLEAIACDVDRDFERDLAQKVREDGTRAA